MSNDLEERLGRELHGLADSIGTPHAPSAPLERVGRRLRARRRASQAVGGLAAAALVAGVGVLVPHLGGGADVAPAHHDATPTYPAEPTQAHQVDGSAGIATWNDGTVSDREDDIGQPMPRPTGLTYQGGTTLARSGNTWWVVDEGANHRLPLGDDVDAPVTGAVLGTGFDWSFAYVQTLSSRPVGDGGLDQRIRISVGNLSLGRRRTTVVDLTTHGPLRPVTLTDDQVVLAGADPADSYRWTLRSDRVQHLDVPDSLLTGPGWPDGVAYVTAADRSAGTATLATIAADGSTTPVGIVRHPENGQWSQGPTSYAYTRLVHGVPDGVVLQTHPGHPDSRTVQLPVDAPDAPGTHWGLVGTANGVLYLAAHQADGTRGRTIRCDVAPSVTCILVPETEGVRATGVAPSDHGPETAPGD